MMSDVSAIAHAAPAERARTGVRGSIRQPARSFDINGCGLPRHPCASTPAGTVGITPRSSEFRCNAHMRRSLRSAAIKAPVS